MAASTVDRPPAKRPVPVVRRVRAGLCVLTAVLTEVVLIGAVGNQESAKAIGDQLPNGARSFGDHVLASLLTFSWRFTKAAGDTVRLWPAQLARVGCVLLFTGLLVWAVCRGVVGFVRIFVGTWLAVIVATQLAQIVFGLVLNLPRRSGTAHVSAAFFGPTGVGPSGTSFFAGLLLGFLVALLTAICGMATRRRVGVLMSNAPGVDEADTWLWGDDDGRAAWPPREWSHPAGGFPGAPGPYPGRPPAWGPPGSYPPPSPYAGGPEPHRQPGPQPAGEPIRQPFPGGGQQPPASRAADPESTQAYDFSDDPDLSDEVPPRQDSTDQATQQMPAADTGGATQQMPAPAPGAPQQMPAPDPEADRTRQLPRVRDE